MIAHLKKIRRFSFWWKYLRENKYQDDTWYFILKYGIGDAYMVSALLPEFIKLNNKVVLLFENKNQVFIPQLFLDNQEVRLVSQPPYELIREFGSFRKGVPIVLHPLHLFNGKLMSVIGLNGSTLMDVYRIILGVDLDVRPQAPHFPAVKDDMIDQLFIQYTLAKGRTVLLCPQANSIGLLDHAFWITLAEKIQRMGLTPVFLNVKANLKGFQSISFSLIYSKEFCDQAGYVVSLRSGFCDLIATSSAKKVILYPNIRFHAARLIESTRLVDLGLSEQEGLLEIEIEIDDEEVVMNKVMDYIDG